MLHKTYYTAFSVVLAQALSSESKGYPSGRGGLREIEGTVYVSKACTTPPQEEGSGWSWDKEETALSDRVPEQSGELHEVPSSIAMYLTQISVTHTHTHTHTHKNRPKSSNSNLSLKHAPSQSHQPILLQQLQILKSANPPHCPPLVPALVGSLMLSAKSQQVKR